MTISEVKTKIQELPDDQLKNIIQELLNAKRENSDLILDEAMEELKTRISEKEFEAFCRGLYIQT